MPSNELKSGLKIASVLVMHERESNSLILTKRSDKLRNHPGEIAFPGGSFERNDKDFYHTALRETEEELGIDASRIELIKALEPEQTLLGYIIYPWLVNLDKLEPYKLDPNEVAAVFTVDMSEVAKKKNYKKVRISRNNINFISCQFVASTHFIWGATAKIMRQLVLLT